MLQQNGHPSLGNHNDFKTLKGCMRKLLIQPFLEQESIDYEGMIERVNHERPTSFSETKNRVTVQFNFEEKPMTIFLYKTLNRSFIISTFHKESLKKIL